MSARDGARNTLWVVLKVRMAVPGADMPLGRRTICRFNMMGDVTRWEL